MTTKFAGRHALVVVRGHDYRRTSRICAPYIRAVPARRSSASTAVPTRSSRWALKPDLIIGDFDSVSERALHAARDLVHHVHPDGRAPGRENLLDWGVDYHEFVAEGTSEDVAMLLAYEAGATLIVAVGTHATMVEFLDKGRRGHGLDVPHAPAARADARRRQGREPSLRGTGATPRLGRCSSAPRSW